MYSWLLLGLGSSTLLFSLYHTLAKVPLEKTQGIVQKIFYFHVPSAFCMYAFLILGCFFSVYFLFDRRKIFDQVARSAIYVATTFATMVILSGPIWAKPIWGVYWTWDPRLTTTFIIFIVLLAYTFARFSMEGRPELRAKAPVISAILAIFAVADIPLVHFSVKLWRGLHPSVLKSADGLAPEFQRAFEMMVLSCFLLSGLMFLALFKYIKLKEDWQTLKEARFQNG